MIRLRTYSPLILLAFLVLTPEVASKAVASGRASYMALRYFAIPVSGLAIGSAIFLHVRSGGLDLFIERASHLSAVTEKRLLWGGMALFIVLYSALPLLRYYSLHNGFFDFGVYDNKLWRISAAPWSDKLYVSSIRHFQPVLILYSLILSTGLPPSILQVLQTLTVVSGVIPLFIIAQDRLKDRGLAISASLLYLLYPATQFNAAMEFHPDHLVIPLFLWAFYFIFKERLLPAVLLLAAACTVKEWMVLLVAFFGLFMIIERRSSGAGVATLVISLPLFYYLAFYFVPSVSGGGTDNSFVNNPAFTHLMDGGVRHILVTILDPLKWRFPMFLFMPLAFVPLLRPGVCIMTLPSIGVALLSTSPHHQNVASQYTAPLIPVVFLAFVLAIEDIQGRRGGRNAKALVLFAFVLILFFNAAHSPGPLSVAFWRRDWSGGYWHYSTYRGSDHEDVLEEAVKMIPTDPNVKVVSHAMVYHHRLASRFFYRPFPERWSEADYIILDNSRGAWLYDNIDRDGLKYRQIVTGIGQGGSFSLLFKKDGMVLFRKKPAAR